MQTIFITPNEDKLTRLIEGSLSLMPITDLIQWIEGSKKSGTLVTSNEDSTRRFFFQDCKLIFVWSDHYEQLLFDAVHQQFGLSVERIIEAIKQAERLGISFIGLLSSEEGIPLEQLGVLISSLTEQALTSTLTWHTGRFRFYDLLPPAVLCSPITIKPTQVLLDSTVQVDEARLGNSGDIDPVLNEVYDLIRKGSIDIPPLPADMQLLMDKINDPSLTIDQIIESITDPLLVSKILRICNSPFYGRCSRVNSLHEAVVYMGIKSLMSIVTVNALSGFSPRHAAEIEKILHHSLMVGMVAKQLAKDMGENHDQAFVCGLLHDLGKVVMLEMLTKYDLDKAKHDKLISDHHESLGALIAKKWNFSEEIQEVIRYHHAPDQAKDYPHLVQMISMANLLANNETPPEPPSSMGAQGQTSVWGAAFVDHLEELDREITAILTTA